MSATHLLLLLISALASTHGAPVKRWFVSPSGDDSSVGASCSGTACSASQPFATMSKALSSCATGDEIVLASGTYTGALNRGLKVTGKELTITGTGAVMDAAGQDRIFEFDGCTINLVGLTLQGGLSDQGGALYVKDTPLGMTDVKMQSNQAGMGGGGALYATGASPVSMTNCVFKDNRATGSGGALSLGAGGTAGASCTVCDFTNNSVYQTSLTQFGKGGAIYARSGLEVTNGTFNMNSAASKMASYGGAIAYEALAVSSVTRMSLQSCSFANSAALYGGAVSMDSASCSATISDSSFQSNTASDLLNLDAFPGHGGAIYASSQAQSSFANVRFEQNTAVQGGAMISKLSAKTTLTGCSFADNNASSYGGAISTISSSAVHLYHSKMIGNHATKAGGGIHILEGELVAVGTKVGSINTCEFMKNSALETGGVFSVSKPAHFNVSGCSLSENKAMSNIGGAVLYSDDSGSAINFGQSVFTSNAAVKGPGGVAILYAPAYAHFMGCEFYKNYAMDAGGALSLQSTAGSVQDCIFKENYVITASQAGGAIALQRNATTSIRRSHFEAQNGIKGTAIFSEESSPALTQCTFYNNSAQNAVLHFTGVGSPSFVECNFTSNQAHPHSKIGTIYLNDKGTPEFSACHFTGNSGPDVNGAAVVVGVDSAPLFSGSHFVDNVALLGGAIYVESIQQTTFSSCTFSSNKAESGGAIHVAAVANAIIQSQCQFTGNKATVSNGGAISSGTNSGVSLKETVFEGNSAVRFGGAAAFGNLAREEFSMNSLTVSHNTAGHAGGGLYWLGNVPGVTTRRNIVQGSQCISCTFNNNSAVFYGPDRASDLYAIQEHSNSSKQFYAGTHLDPPLQLVLTDYFNQQLRGPKTGDGIRCGFSHDASLDHTAGSNVSFSYQGEVDFEKIEFAGVPGITYQTSFTCDWEQCVGDEIVPKSVQTFGTLYQDTCPLGHVSTHSQDVAERVINCVYCVAGSFSVEAGDTECTRCFKGATCMGGHEVSAHPGYWKAKVLSGHVYKCSTPDACPGGYGPSCNTGYENNLCQRCESGYSQVGEECLKCDGSTADLMKLWGPLIILCALFLILLVVLKCSKKSTADYFLPSVQRKAEVKITANEAREMLAISSSKTGSGNGNGQEIELKNDIGPDIEDPQGPENDVDVFEQEDQEMIRLAQEEVANQAEVEQRRSIAARRILTGMIKICFSYLQVTSLIVTAMPVVPWPNRFASIASIFSFTMFDLFQVVPSGCVFGIVPFWIKSMSVVVLFILLCSFIGARMNYYVTQKNKLAEKEKANKKKYSAKVYYQEAEDVKCEHYRALFWVFFMMYPILSNTAFTVFSCKKIESDWYLATDLAERCYEGPAWVVSATLSGILGPIILAGIPLAIYFMLSRNRHKISRPKHKGRLSFLYENYKKDYFMFEVVEMIRKALQTSLIMFIMPGTTGQVAAALIIAFTFVAIQFKHAPFQDSVLNQLQMVSLYAITMTLWGGLLLKSYECAEDDNKVDMKGYDKTVTEMFIYLSNLMAVVLMVYIIVTSGYRMSADAAAELAKSIEEGRAKRLKHAAEQAARKARKAKYDVAAPITEAETHGMDSVWADPPPSSKLTALVVPDDLLNELNCKHKVDTAVDALVGPQDPARQVLNADIKTYIATCFENRCLWLLVKFEEARDELASMHTGAQDNAQWPPVTESGVTQMRATLDKSFKRVSSSLETQLNEEFDRNFASSVSHWHRFDSMSGKEVAKTRVVMRKIAESLSTHFTHCGLAQLKSQIDRIMLDADTKVKTHKKDNFDDIIKAQFDRHSYDGSKIFGEDELNDLITGVVFVGQDILPQGSLEHALECSKALQRTISSGLTCAEFTAWFNDNVLHPKPKVKAPEPAKSDQSEMRQKSVISIYSETATSELMAQLAAEGEDSGPRSKAATSKLQERIAARKKRLADKKAAFELSMQ